MPRSAEDIAFGDWLQDVGHFIRARSDYHGVIDLWWLPYREWFAAGMRPREAARLAVKDGCTPCRTHRPVETQS